MRFSTSYLSSIFLILIQPFNISAQEYNDVWLRDWVNNQGISNTLAGRNLSITAGDYVYEAVHQLNDDGQHDLVLSKSTLKGVQVWIDTFNLAATTANILLGDMILDGNDDILITGAVYNGSNNYDALTLKYTSAGSLSWYELYDGTASFCDGGLRIAVDANDDVFVTGGTSSSTSNMDLLVLAYESDGTPSWSATYDGFSAFDTGSYVDASGAGSLHIVALSEVVSGTNSKWLVVNRKYNPSNGSLILSETSEEVALSEVRDVTLDANDNIYITGWKPTTTQGRDIVVVKLDDGATILWEQTFNGTADANDQPNAIAVATNGDVIVGGFSTTSSGDRDGLLLKYNSSGTLQWQQTISGAASGEDEITDVLVSTGSNEIYLCGQIHETADEDYLFQRRSNSNGSLLHELTFAGWVGGTDRAEILLEDEEGGIIMSGKTAAGVNGQFPTAVRFAKKDYFLPPTSETPNAALPYIHQYDQLTKTNGTVAEDIKYYAGNHYLENAQLSIVQARIDTVPTTPDTLCRVDVTFSDDKSQRVFALDKRSSYHNYYLGHINEGRTKVPLTDQVLHTDAWTGIDILHGSNGAGHTYDIIIEPGVDPDAIIFTFTGHTSLAVNGSGELEITTALGTIVWPEPTLSSYDAAGTSYSNSDTPAYSLVGSNKVEITGVNSVSNRYLVIGVRGGVMASPTADSKWITYFGDSNDANPFAGDLFSSIDTNEENDLLIGGATFNGEIPVSAGVVTVYGNVDNNSFNSILLKFDLNHDFNYATIFGGTSTDISHDLKVINDNVFVVGETRSNNFPVTGGANNAVDTDGFIGKFDLITGERLLLELFTGSDADLLSTIDISSTGRVFVGGIVNSNISLVTLSGAYNQPFNGSAGDCVILEYDQELEIIWSSLFGGNLDIEQLYDLTVKPNDTGFYIYGSTPNAFYNPTLNTPPSAQQSGFPNYKTSTTDTQFPFNNGGNDPNQSDAFIGEFDGANQLLWTTFIGGNESENQPYYSHSKLAINPANPTEIAIVGATENFGSFPTNPATTGYLQTTNEEADFVMIFVDRVIDRITAFGCTGDNVFYSDESTVHYTSVGELIITGLTSCDPVSVPDCEPPASGDFPYCPPPGVSSVEFDQSTNNGGQDAYIAVLGTDRTLSYASFFGGDGKDGGTDAVYIPSSRTLFLVGNTSSVNNFPVSFPSGAYMQENLAGSVDGFIAELCFDETITNSREPVISNELKLFPNPTTGRVILQIPSNYFTVFEEMNFSIFNGLGELVMPRTLILSANDRIEFDLSNLPAGLYYYKLGKYAGQIIKVQ